MAILLEKHKPHLYQCSKLWNVVTVWFAAIEFLLLYWHGLCDVSITLCDVSVTLLK